MNHEIEPSASFGDVVKADGYGAELFQVDGYTVEYHYEPNSYFCEIIYDLTCVYGSSGYIIADQDDITLVCREATASAFIANYEPDEKPAAKPTFMRDLFNAIGNGGEKAMVKRVKTESKPKEPTRQERIDALLDERHDVMATGKFITVDDVEYEQRRLDEIDAQLNELLGG